MVLANREAAEGQQNRVDASTERTRTESHSTNCVCSSSRWFDATCSIQAVIQARSGQTTETHICIKLGSIIQDKLDEHSVSLISENKEQLQERKPRKDISHILFRFHCTLRGSLLPIIYIYIYTRILLLLCTRMAHV